jgi:hypothetical protein
MAVIKQKNDLMKEKETIISEHLRKEIEKEILQKEKFVASSRGAKRSREDSDWYKIREDSDCRRPSLLGNSLFRVRRVTR